MIKKEVLYLIFATISILPFISCVTTNPAGSKPVSQDGSFLRENGTVNPVVKGYWKSIGNGYMLDATSDSIFLYSYTRSFCYKEKNDYIERLLNDKARFVRIKDTLRIYATDFGEKSTILQLKRDYIKIERLPENCLSFSQMQNLGAKKLFDLFIETYEENYAFSKERNLNWNAIKTEFEGKITDSTTDNELFQLLGQIAIRTKDHHTKVINEDGQTMQYQVTPSAEIVSEAFKNQSTVDKLDDYFNLFFTTNYKNISDSLLHGKGSKVANGKLEWGSLNDKIGYISIYSFDGFAPKGYTRKQQIDSINHYMDHIIEALKHKEAIILDVSFNFGGYDAASLTMASYFIDKPKLAYTSQVYNNGAFYDESKVHIYPADKITYTKPVYILMTDISRSQAEGFVMTMKANANVKLVGTNTLGILSTMLGKSVGSFYCTLSNQRLMLPNGKYYEVSGVEPDIRMKVFSKENILGAHKAAVRKIVEMIEAE